MSRKVFLAVSAVVMLVLALVVVRFFRDPMPVTSQDVVIGGAGDSVSGPLALDGEPVKSALPSAQSMVMSTGDASGETLRVSEAAPVAGDAPSQAAAMVRDSAASSAMVTEPPSSPVAPQLVSPSTSGATSGATSASAPVSGAAAQKTDAKPEARADEAQASGGKAGVTGSYGIASSATPPAATKENVALSSTARPASAPEAAKSANQAAAPASDSTSGQTGQTGNQKPAQADAPTKVEASAKTETAPAAESAQKKPESAPATKTAQTEEAPVKPGTLVTKSSLAAKAGSPTVTTATLSMDGDVVTLRLTGSQALKGKTFQLKNPDRVVLDLDGLWNVEAPRVPSNRMLGALRVGNQAQATRLVFDMKVTPGKASVTQINANTIELRIR